MCIQLEAVICAQVVQAHLGDSSSIFTVGVKQVGSGTNELIFT